VVSLKTCLTVIYLLHSGDVGIGLNVRRMVLDYLGSFTTAYSLRPIGGLQTGCSTCADCSWIAVRHA
jgi:hypothetical protein